ncbi:hypothetical protein PB70LOC_04473 [Pectobacterium versatile]|uniref:hypothetical protein n=1 Tax=Pectobacterium TaxID=122277 RepID=UPI000D4A4B75|nr:MULTISPECIES: hypothetical protein [Pectobacterium]POY54817.1 hypothetical protein PB70LOC_04473 [Pectobacterium versatile]POY60850.1 hypothetical protein PB69LOC_04473 [Pectobacterium versatile]
MSVIDGNNGDGSNGASPQQIVQRVEYTRTDVATTRRALSDLELQRSRLGEQVQRRMATASTANLEEFQAAWNDRSSLNDVNDQISSIRQTLESMMPSESSARLSQDERTQITGLYASGLYTQSQLAQQYGVSQPTIGDIVRRPPPSDTSSDDQQS